MGSDTIKIMFRVFQWLLVFMALELGVILYQAHKAYSVQADVSGVQEMIDFDNTNGSYKQTVGNK